MQEIDRDRCINREKESKIKSERERERARESEREREREQGVACMAQLWMYAWTHSSVLRVKGSGCSVGGGRLRV